MNILDMTLRQIIQAIGHNTAIDLVVLSGALNLEAIVRQVAVNKGYKGVVSWCDRIASVITFVFDVVTTAVKKQAPKAVPLVLLCFGLVFSMGCASGSYNESCGQIVANGSYATATGSGAGYACHAGYVGFGKPDYTAITTLSTNYANNVNKVTTTVPITVAVVASQK